jgi:hypothetical protein
MSLALSHLLLHQCVDVIATEVIISAANERFPCPEHGRPGVVRVALGSGEELILQLAGDFCVVTRVRSDVAGPRHDYIVSIVGVNVDDALAIFPVGRSRGGRVSRRLGLGSKAWILEEELDGLLKVVVRDAQVLLSLRGRC